MRRRALIVGLVCFVGGSRFAASSQPAKVRIGYLAPSSVNHPLAHRNVTAFREALAALGYLEGQNIEVEYRFAENQFDRLPALAAELVRLSVAVIVAGPTPAAVAAKGATSTIPIVMINTFDPVGLGLVANLARPGGNVTGLAFTVGAEIFGKGFDIFREAIPELRRVAVLSNPANPAHAIVLRGLQTAVGGLGIELRFYEARVPQDFESAFRAISEARAGGLYVIPDVLFVSQAASVAALATAYKLPSLHQFREEVVAGGLLAYGHSNTDPWRHAATFVDRLLKGAKAADLPVQQPTKFELAINLRTAKAIGLTIPPTLLARADEVIE